MFQIRRSGIFSKVAGSTIDFPVAQGHVAVYATHMAALVGAPVIKFKPPTKGLEQDAAKAVYEKTRVRRAILAERVRHIVQSSFAGRRIIIFSGGAAQDKDGLLEEIRGLLDCGANGSIIGI